jgi:hypothetical protein
VIVYGHHAYTLDVPAVVRDLGAHISRLPSTPDSDAIVDLLVDLGEACSALIDARSPHGDDDVDSLREWSGALRAAASGLVASLHHDDAAVSAAIARARCSILALDAAIGDVGGVPARTAEGFAHYSLFPHQYVLAAERFADACAPQSVACIGIRTIGVPLAYVVAAALERRGVATRVFTVRPRGMPFDRTVALSDRLRRRIREADASHYAIIDEGPGLSGSSFAAVSEALQTLGVAAAAIVLFPSWEAPAAALRSRRGQRAWQRHAHITASFEEVFAPDPRSDISAGKWRQHVFGGRVDRWPAVQPQHEKRKYLQHADGGAVVSRFAGLGRYGRAKLRRAEALAAGGFGPAPIALANGFLTQTWIDGTPLGADDAGSAAVADRVASYLAFLRRTFPTGRCARVADLVDMVAVNVRDALEPEALAPIDPLLDEAAAFDEAEIAVDGRLLPYEWVSAGSDLVKMDALDHHADDFLPGSRDIAWDVAGAIVELGLDAPRRARLIARYQARAGDRTIARRLPFYETAYLSYRIGYTALALESVRATPDGPRFARLTERYRRSLAARAAVPRRTAQRR